MSFERVSVYRRFLLFDSARMLFYWRLRVAVQCCFSFVSQRFSASFEAIEVNVQIRHVVAVAFYRD